MSYYGTFSVWYDTDNDGVPETDLSADVVTDLQGEYGDFNTSAVDFLSGGGSCRFELDNSAGAYTTLAIGRRVDIKVSDGIYSKVVFSGKIAPARIDPREWGDRRVRVTLDNWMKIANNNGVGELQAAENKTADQAMEILLAPMSRPPAHTDFASGTETYPDVFDGVSKHTNIYSEMDRIVKSELANCYVRYRDHAHGETLVLENQHSRGILTPLSQILIDAASVSDLKFHDSAGASGKLKYHGASSTSGFIQLAELQDATFDRLHSDADWQRGDYLVNVCTVTDVNRVFSAAPEILFDFEGRGDQLTSPGTGAMDWIGGTFSNPNDRSAFIGGKDIITPVATTDYLFNSEADGSGTDLTANIVIIAFGYGVGGWSCIIKNLGEPAMCIKWQVRGTGIYKNSNTEYVAENLQSINEIILEEKDESIKREYSVNRNTSKTFADGTVALYRLPANNMRSASFTVSTQRLMRAFMFLDVGSKVQITEGTPSHTGKYYIRGLRFTLRLGGTISFTWSLEEAIETYCQPIAVRAPTTSGGSRVALDFGVLPYMANLSALTWSFWVKFSGSGTFFFSKLVDEGTGERGHLLSYNSLGALSFLSRKTPTDGVWSITAPSAPTVDTWYHIMVTYDTTTDTADPVVYINNAAPALTETMTPSGTTDDDSDARLILFNSSPSPSLPETRYYYDTIRKSTIKNVRVYNRIISSTERAALYAGPDTYGNVTDGLLFQGIYAPTGFISEYVNDGIEGDDFLLDAVHRAAGIPYNEDESADSTMLYGLSI